MFIYKIYAETIHTHTHTIEIINSDILDSKPIKLILFDVSLDE